MRAEVDDDMGSGRCVDGLRTDTDVAASSVAGGVPGGLVATPPPPMKPVARLNMLAMPYPVVPCVVGMVGAAVLRGAVTRYVFLACL